MINVGTLSKLRRMVLRENVSVREAARRLRISRNTAKRWLAEPEMVEPVYPKRVAAQRLIDAYAVSGWARHLDRAGDSGLRLPAVWKQFVNATVQVAWQLCQHVLQISPRVMPM